MAQVNGRRHDPPAPLPLNGRSRADSLNGRADEAGAAEGERHGEGSAGGRSAESRRSPPAPERRGRVSSSANGVKAPPAGLVLTEGLPMAPRVAGLPARPLSATSASSFTIPPKPPSTPSAPPSASTTASFLAAGRDSPVKISFGAASRPRDRRDSTTGHARRVSTSSSRPGDLLNVTTAPSSQRLGESADLERDLEGSDDLEKAAIKALLVESSVGQSDAVFRNGLMVTATALNGGSHIRPVERLIGGSHIRPAERLTGKSGLPQRPDAALAAAGMTPRDSTSSVPAPRARRRSLSASSSSGEGRARYRSPPRRSPSRDRVLHDGDVYIAELSDDERERSRRTRVRDDGRRRRDYASRSRSRDAVSPDRWDERRRDRSRDRGNGLRRREYNSPERADYGNERGSGYYPSRYRDDEYSPPRRRRSPPPASHAMSRTPSYDTPSYDNDKPRRQDREGDRDIGRDSRRNEYGDHRERRRPSPVEESRRHRGRSPSVGEGLSKASASGYLGDDNRYSAAPSDHRGTNGRDKATDSAPAKPSPPPLVNGTGIKIQLKSSSEASAPQAPAARPSRWILHPPPGEPELSDRPKQGTVREDKAMTATQQPTVAEKKLVEPLPPDQAIEATWEAPLKPKGFCQKSGRGNYKCLFDPATDRTEKSFEADKRKLRLDRLDGIDPKGRDVPVTDPRTQLSAKGLGAKANRLDFVQVLSYPWDEWSTSPKPVIKPKDGVTITGLHPLTADSLVVRQLLRYGPIDEHNLKINRDGTSLGIFWAKFRTSTQGKSGEEIARQVVVQLDGTRIGTGLQAASEKIKVVLDGTGEKADQAEKEELARRKALAKATTGARNTKAASTPTKVDTPRATQPSTAPAKPTESAVAKPSANAVAASSPAVHHNLLQRPGSLARPAQWWAGPNAQAGRPAVWRNLQAPLQSPVGAKYSHLPFHPLNQNRLQAGGAGQIAVGAPSPSSRPVVAAPKMSAESFAAAPLADAESESGSEDEDEARKPDIRLARIRAAGTNQKDAGKLRREVSDALAKNGQAYLFIDKNDVAPLPANLSKVQKVFKPFSSQAVLYDNRGWYILFANARDAKRIIRSVDGQLIDGRAIRVELREATLPSSRAPLSERQLGNVSQRDAPQAKQASTRQQHSEAAEPVNVANLADREGDVEDMQIVPISPGVADATEPAKSSALIAKAPTDETPLVSSVEQQRVDEEEVPAPETTNEDDVSASIEALLPPESTVEESPPLSVPSKRKPSAKERKAKQPANKKRKKQVVSPEVEDAKPLESVAVISLPDVLPAPEAIDLTIDLKPRLDVDEKSMVKIDDPIAAGIADDDEDVYLLSQLLKRVEEGNLPEAPTTQPHQIDQDAKHFTGCARTQGYYKVSELEKNAYLPSRNRAAIQDDQAAAAAAASNTATAASGTVTSRSNRVATRRLVQGLQQHQKATATDTDVFQFNQLRARKKHLKFSKSPIHDWGLYAMEHIPAGEMVIEYVGEVIRAQVAEIREKYYEKTGIGSSYLFRVDDDAVVDATKKGNLGRLINHCCAPNCTAKIITINGEKKIVIYAKTSIEPGEEITYDYHFPIENNKIPCLCGSPKCRGYLN